MVMYRIIEAARPAVQSPICRRRPLYGITLQRERLLTAPDRNRRPL